MRARRVLFSDTGNARLPPASHHSFQCDPQLRKRVGMSGSKRKAGEQSDAAPLPNVEIIPLGAGQEVGRSCIIVKYM